MAFQIYANHGLDCVVTQDHHDIGRILCRDGIYTFRSTVQPFARLDGQRISAAFTEDHLIEALEEALAWAPTQYRPLFEAGE